MGDKVKKSYEMPTIKKVQINDTLRVTVYGGKNDEHWYDIRYFNEKDGNPTRRGVRLRRSWISEIINVYEELDDPCFKQFLSELNEDEKKNKK